MKAVVLYEQGGVEKLVYTDYPDPEITVSEVLVQVEACALNRLGGAGVQQGHPRGARGRAWSGKLRVTSGGALL